MTPIRTDQLTACAALAPDAFPVLSSQTQGASVKSPVSEQASVWGAASSVRSYSSVLSSAQVSCVQNETTADNSCAETQALSQGSCEKSGRKTSNNTRSSSGEFLDKQGVHDAHGENQDKPSNHIVETNSDPGKKARHRRGTRSRSSKSRDRQAASGGFTNSAESRKKHPSNIKPAKEDKEPNETLHLNHSLDSKMKLAMRRSQMDVRQKSVESNKSPGPRATDPDHPKRKRTRSHNKLRNCSENGFLASESKNFNMASEALTFDDNEFPNLLSAMNQIADSFGKVSYSPVSYSAVASGGVPPVSVEFPFKIYSI